MRDGAMLEEIERRYPDLMDEPAEETRNGPVKEAGNFDGESEEGSLDGQRDEVEDSLAKAKLDRSLDNLGRGMREGSEQVHRRFEDFDRRCGDLAAQREAQQLEIRKAVGVPSDEQR